MMIAVPLDLSEDMFLKVCRFRSECKEGAVGISCKQSMSVPHPLHPFSADILERIQRSRPRSGQTAASRTTVQHPKTPLRGK